MVTVKTRSGDERGYRESLAFRPVQRTEDADRFPGIASNCFQTRIFSQPVPLDVIMLRRVPQEGVADRCVGGVEQLLSQASERFPLIILAQCVQKVCQDL